MSPKNRALAELWEKLENGEGRNTLIQFQECMSWFIECDSTMAKNWRSKLIEKVNQDNRNSWVHEPVMLNVPDPKPDPAPTPITTTSCEADLSELYRTIQKICDEEGFPVDEKIARWIAGWKNFSKKVVREYARAKSYCQEFVREGIEDPWNKAKGAVLNNETAADVISRYKGKRMRARASQREDRNVSRVSKAQADSPELPESQPAENQTTVTATPTKSVTATTPKEVPVIDKVKAAKPPKEMKLSRFAEKSARKNAEAYKEAPDDFVRERTAKHEQCLTTSFGSVFEAAKSCQLAAV